jgi:hypothetical protein
MKSGSVKILAIVVVILFGALYALNTANHRPDDAEGALLVPELKERLNDLDSVTITHADGKLTIVRQDDVWRVRDKSGYPADTAALRRVLLAISESRKVEQKTANPSLYDRLGVQHPAEQGGDGVLIEASAPEFGFYLILGDSAQGDYRYARIPAESQSWLIDRNPELPDDIAGWLRAEIVDIGSADIQSVEIRHSDGETIRLSKDNAEAGTFTVTEIPEGRELSYPTVVNGIAGALGNLTLEDVARIDEGFTPTATATFVTFDGLEVRVASSEIDEETWITLDASSASGESAAPQSSEETPVAAGGPPAETGGEQPPDDESAAQEDIAPSPAEQAVDINARTAGWRYRIATYKADQFTRRWQDILKAEDEE